jgi:hypothetical protein
MGKTCPEQDAFSRYFMSKKQIKHVTPKLKKFWQRAILGVVVSVAGSLLVCWLLSQVDLDTLNQSGYGSQRRAMIRLMLSLMSPTSWCWVLAGSLIVLGFLGDWHYYRFKDLPDVMPDQQ